VVKAARIVLMNPSNQESAEHFELLKKQWLENAEKLRSLVDEAIDTAAFIRANGELLQQTVLMALLLHTCTALHASSVYVLMTPVSV